MKISTMISMGLLVGAGASAVAAFRSDTTGSHLALNGSATLFDVTNAILASCGAQFSDFAGQGLSYQGGGSSVGALAMGLGAQQVSPMSRALKSDEYCSIPAPASATLAESLLIGLDGVAITANQTNSCSNVAANGFGTTAAFAVTSDGTASGSAPATCPGCDGDTYTFADSFDALKVLYFGLTHDGTYDCSGPVRRSLVRNWKNLFSSDCAAGDATCSAGLTHAWRRGDFSGATDALLSILDLPAGTPGNGKGAAVAIGIGTPLNNPAAGFPSGGIKRSNPFCNSSDANAIPATTSLGGSSDYQDLDPIRTPCVAGRDGVCEGFKTPAARFAGDLGIVLPMVLPGTPTVLPSDLYPQVACGTSCTLVAVIKGDLIPSAFRCPGGAPPIAGCCFMPYAGSAAAPDPRCVAASTTKCAGIVGQPDGREFNLVTVVSGEQVPIFTHAAAQFQFALDSNLLLMTGSFYRIHANAAGAGNVPEGAVGQTGICRESDEDAQIGCLSDSDPCSIGYAGREAAKTYPGRGTPAVPQPAPFKALAVNGIPPFTPASVSPDPDLALENLLQPPGTAPLYPLARRLYFTTLYGFGNLKGGEQELAQCYANNSLVGPAISGQGFVAIPGGVQCLDYPESAGTATPPPNIQGAGNVALGGCGFATNNDACATSGPNITN